MTYYTHIHIHIYTYCIAVFFRVLVPLKSGRTYIINRMGSSLEGYQTIDQESFHRGSVGGLTGPVGGLLTQGLQDLPTFLRALGLQTEPGTQGVPTWLRAPGINAASTTYQPRKLPYNNPNRLNIWRLYRALCVHTYICAYIYTYVHIHIHIHTGWGP